MMNERENKPPLYHICSMSSIKNAYFFCVLFVLSEGIIDSKNNLRTKLLLLLSKVKVHTYSLMLGTILFPVLTRFSLSGYSISAGDLYVILCIMGWMGVNDWCGIINYTRWGGGNMQNSLGTRYATRIAYAYTKEEHNSLNNCSYRRPVNCYIQGKLCTHLNYQNAV